MQLRQKISVTLQYGNYQWTFDGANGGSVPDKQKFYDFSLEMLSQHNLTAAAEGGDLLPVLQSVSGTDAMSSILNDHSWCRLRRTDTLSCILWWVGSNLQKTAEAVVNQDGTVCIPNWKCGKIYCDIKGFVDSGTKLKKCLYKLLSSPRALHWIFWQCSGNCSGQWWQRRNWEAQEAAQETTENEEISANRWVWNIGAGCTIWFWKSVSGKFQRIVVIASIAVVVILLEQ